MQENTTAPEFKTTAEAQVPTDLPLSPEQEPIIITGGGDFLGLAEKDSEGNYAGIFYLNRNQIVAATYSAIEDKMLVTINAQTTKTGKVYEPLLNKNNEPTKAYAQGVASKTESLSFPFRDRHSIVAIHNFVTGSTDTIESYIGFKLYDDMKVKVEEFRKMKEAEEAEIQRQEAESEMRKEYDEEVKRLNSYNMEVPSFEEFKRSKYGESTQSEGGQTTGVQGEEAPVIPIETATRGGDTESTDESIHAQTDPKAEA